MCNGFTHYIGDSETLKIVEEKFLKCGSSEIGNP